jgi:hypothetical protein
MTVKKIRRGVVCRCCAYPFPHRERGGKCADERDAQELREWQAALSRMSLIQRQGRVWYQHTL